MLVELELLLSVSSHLLLEVLVPLSSELLYHVEVIKALPTVPFLNILP